MLSSISHFALLAASESGGGGPVQAITEGFGLNEAFFFGQLINFLLVASLLYFFAFRPILRTVAERQEKIEDGLRYSDEMKAKLADAERAQEETLRKASVEAQQIVKEARLQAKELLDKQAEDARRKAEEILHRGELAIETERKKMMAEVREEVSRLVVVTSSRVLDRELSSEERNSYSEKATRELAGV